MAVAHRLGFTMGKATASATVTCRRPRVGRRLLSALELLPVFVGSSTGVMGTVAEKAIQGKEIEIDGEMIGNGLIGAVSGPPRPRLCAMPRLEGGKMGASGAQQVVARQ